MPVDTGIEQTVVALRLLGFKTTMSCAGHADRITTGPYVMCESDEARTLYRSIESLRDVEAGEIGRRNCQAITLREANRLRTLIDHFSTDRTTATSSVQRLEIRPVGHWGFRVCFVNADFDAVDALPRRITNLEQRQREIIRFTNFLKREIENQLLATG